MVLAVVTFIGGLFYGTAGYFLLGVVVWIGARAVGLERAAARPGSWSASPRFRSPSRSLVTVPAIVFAFGNDWFRTGGSDDGTGRAVVARNRACVRALVARAARRSDCGRRSSSRGAELSARSRSPP